MNYSEVRNIYKPHILNPSFPWLLDSCSKFGSMAQLEMKNFKSDSSTTELELIFLTKVIPIHSYSS